MDDGGGGGAGEDPFDSLVPLCHVSASQEERLRRCPFAPEPYDPEDDEEESDGGGIWMASTPIRLVSPPESGEEENDFHTPPEEASMPSSNELRPATEVHGRDEGDFDRRNFEERDGGGESGDAVVVDLSRDSGLGFSEVEAAQRENPNLEVSDTELRENRVLAKELPLDAGLGESSLKKLKIAQQNSEECNEELEMAIVTPSDRGFDFNGKRRSAKRKLELGDDENSDEFVGLESEANHGVSKLQNAENNELNGDAGPQSNGQERISVKEFMEAMDILRHDSAGDTQETADVELRRLPSSILGRAENVAVTAEDDKGLIEVTILDVLKLLSEDCNDDTSGCSFLEISKRRGMTFPRPVWWPAKMPCFGDDDMEVESF